MVEVLCPHCGVSLKAPEDRVGKKAKCKKCRQGFRVPGPIPLAESVGEPQMLSTLGMPAPPMPMPLPDDDEDDRTELMTADQMPPLPPVPPPKAKPAPPPAKDLAALPSADPFDFSKPAAPVPAPVPAAKPAFGAGRAAPAAKPAPAPVPTAKPAPAPAAPAPVPAAKPAFGAAKAAPAKPAPEPLPIADAQPVEDIPFDEPEPPKAAKPKAKAKPAAEPLPEPEPEPASAGNAFAFGFGDEPTPEDETPRRKKRREPVGDDEPEELPRKKKKLDDESEEPARKKKKPDDGEPDGDEPEDKPRYRRPEETGSGMAKMLLITAVVGFLALGLGIAAIVVYVKNNRPEPVKEEKKKEEPIPEPAPPVVIPPVTPKDKVDPKPKDKVDPKPKDKEPDPKPKEKEPEPVPTRPLLALAGKFPSFDVGKEPAKFDRADKPGEPRFVLDTAFASMLRVFPSFDPKSADSYVVVRDGAKFSLDAYSPSSDKRVSRLAFAADATRPICDVFSSATESRFLAVSDGKITVWNLADQKKVADAVDPYAGKPDHQANGIAAAFFSAQSSQIVVVSTAGAVHLYSLPAGASVSEFVPPHGAKGRVVLHESVARAEGGGSIVLAVGGVVYQIKSGGNLERLRTHDLTGDVKPLAVAASGTPGRLLFAFETDAKGKKDRALFYLPPGAAAKPVITLWPAAAGNPKGAFWVGDTSAGVIVESGVVWFDEEINKFGPLVVTRPAAGGLYLGAGNLFWYVVPHPSKPAQSVLAPLAVPFEDAFDYRREAGTRLRVVRIDSNGLAK